MIAEALDAFARATARSFDGRENTIGASEIGACARRVYFSKNEGDWLQGVPRDVDYVDAWGAAQRGTIFETAVWEPALRRRFGKNLLFAGAEQQTLASGYLSATPDGLLVDLPRDVLEPFEIEDIGEGAALVVECKTADPRSRLDEPRPEHIYQINVQIGLIRELTPYRPEFGLISYANASFWDEVIEFPVAFNERVFAAAKARAAKIMTAQSPLKPEGWIAGGRECEHCPFTVVCGRLRHAVPTGPAADPPDSQFIAEIADLARRAQRRRADVEAATTGLRETEHAIRERLRAKGVRKIEGDGASITWSAVKGRPSFDMKGIREAAEKAGIDLAEFETTGQATDRLTIRVTDPIKQTEREP